MVHSPAASQQPKVDGVDDIPLPPKQKFFCFIEELEHPTIWNSLKKVMFAQFDPTENTILRFVEAQGDMVALSARRDHYNILNYNTNENPCGQPPTHFIFRRHANFVAHAMMMQEDQLTEFLSRFGIVIKGNSKEDSVDIAIAVIDATNATLKLSAPQYQQLGAAPGLLVQDTAVHEVTEGGIAYLDSDHQWYGDGQTSADTTDYPPLSPSPSSPFRLIEQSESNDKLSTDIRTDPTIERPALKRNISSCLEHESTCRSSNSSSNSSSKHTTVTIAKDSDVSNEMAQNAMHSKLYRRRQEYNNWLAISSSECESECESEGVSSNPVRKRTKRDDPVTVCADNPVIKSSCI